MSSTTLLEVRGVSYSYLANRDASGEVLSNITLPIKKGDMIALVGPNGGGKTTLVKVILGILKPQQGSVKTYTPRHKISYVPQYFYSGKDYPLSALQTVLMGLGKGRRVYSKNDKAQAMAVLDRFDMGSLANKRVGTLSPGQLQKVIISRAVISKPSLIIMDEPLSGIDESGQGEVYAMLNTLNGEGTAIVAVTHDLYVVPEYFQTIACINKTLHFHGASSNMDEVAKVIYGQGYQRLVHIHDDGLPVRVLDCHTCQHNPDNLDADLHNHNRHNHNRHNHSRHDDDADVNVNANTDANVNADVNANAGCADGSCGCGSRHDDDADANTNDANTDDANTDDANADVNANAGCADGSCGCGSRHDDDASTDVNVNASTGKG